MTKNTANCTDDVISSNKQIFATEAQDQPEEAQKSSICNKSWTIFQSLLSPSIVIFVMTSFITFAGTAFSHSLKSWIVWRNGKLVAPDVHD